VPRYDVNGRVALVTGGARGIGFATASALARRGASIALVDLDGDEAAASAERLGSGRAIGLAADVRDSGAVEGAVAAAAERFGGVDIVIANAGIAPPPSPVRLMEPGAFERVIEVNLLGVYHTVHAGMDQIVTRRGQMVLVSSVYAFVNGVMASPYAVAKAGVEQLGRALRLELAPHGAGATVAYFGFVDTKLVQDAFEERERLSGGRDTELVPEFVLRRIMPEQAGEAIARGIERRQPRVIAPRWWATVSVLRGVLNPLLDYAGAHSSRVKDELRQAETAAAQGGQGPSGGS
jgi:NAD(P)-dependent dehydrogenase (short-subunit alcohol dehydrogenase family)